MLKVSVIIPTYNRAELLPETIGSILAQTFRDFEIIVVDDGSTDNTKEVVESFNSPSIRYIYQANLGVSAARTTGIKASSGEYIAFLDSDDIWLPENLELKVKRLDSHPEVALVCSDAYVFDDKTGANLGRFWRDKPFHYWINPQKASEQPLKEMLSRGCFIGPPLALVRRLAFANVGYFDESLPTFEDWDIFIRIIQRFPIEIIDTPLVRIRQHGAGLQSNQDKMHFGEVTALNKMIRSNSLSKAELRLARRRLARSYYQYGQYMVIKAKTNLGRGKLLFSIRVNPWSIGPYIYLFLSLLGRKRVLTIKSWKKWVKRHFVQLQLSGEVQSSGN